MKVKTVIVSAVFSLISGVVLAGQSVDVPIEIDMESMSAAGNMKTARFSENEFSQIGCGTRTYSDETGNQFFWGFCQASNDDIEENRAFCVTEDAVLLNEINSLTDLAYVTFRWNEDGNCTYIGNSTQSQYIAVNKAEARKVKKDNKKKD